MLNIPMPGAPGDSMMKGFESMSGQMARLLAAKIQREQMAQQGQQFGQSFGLQQAQENRLAALSPYQQRLLQAQASQAEQEAQQLAFQQNMIKSFFGGQAPVTGMNNQAVPSSNGVNLPSSAPGVPMPQQGVPMPQQGVPMPQPGGAPVASASPANYGNLEKLKNNPLVANYIKHATKGAIDLLAETPSGKSDREFQDFKRKEEYKKNVSKDLLTSSSVDALQKSIIGIDQVLPMLEELKKTKPGALNGWWSPSNQAEYEGIVSNIIEPLLASKGLTGTVENSHAMRATVERKRGEDFDRWLKRIDNEIAIVKRIKKENTQMLKEGKVISKSNEMKNGIINGRNVTVSPENLESFKASGGVISD